jgi:hypothetical protein
MMLPAKVGRSTIAAHRRGSRVQVHILTVQAIVAQRLLHILWLVHR